MAWRGSRVIRLEDGLSDCAPGGRRKSRSAPPHRRGIALAWTAIVLLVMILMVGLGIDAGLAALGLHQLQNAVDAGSLAGAQIVKTDADGAVVRSHDVALLNDVMRLPVFLRTTRQPDPFDGAEDAYDILVGRWVSQNHTFFPTLDASNAVQAVGRRLADLGGPSPPVGLVFGGMAGVPTVDLTRLSVAWCFDSAGAGLICLSPDAVPGLYVYGNAQIDVENGGIHVNSIAMGMKKNAGTHVQGHEQRLCGQRPAGLLKFLGHAAGHHVDAKHLAAAHSDGVVAQAELGLKGPEHLATVTVHGHQSSAGCLVEVLPVTGLFGLVVVAIGHET